MTVVLHMLYELQCPSLNVRTQVAIFDIFYFSTPYLFSTNTIMKMSAKIHSVKGLGTGDAVDFDSMWQVLEASLREIHTKNASKLSFEELYRNAYKLVLKKRGEILYERVKDFEEGWLGNEVRPQILAVARPVLSLFDTNASAIATVNEKRVAGERLLRALKQAWEDHNLCMNMTTDVLMYMVGCPRLMFEISRNDRITNETNL